MAAPVSWNERRKNWVGRPRTPDPQPTQKDDPVVPTIEREPVLIVPEFPVFSPAAVAALLHEYRSTVQYWMDHGKLDSIRDNIGDRYILRMELIRFVRDYLKRTCQEE